MGSLKGIIRKSRQGFTLVELLIVVGIVALLIGIIIPVLSRAHAAQKSIICLNNLRQIGNAFHLYAQDNHLTLPDPGATGYSWEQLLSPYYQGQFQCPADEELYPTVGSSYDWRDTPDADTTLAGTPLAAVRRMDLVFVFESLPGWHTKGKINVLLFDGSAQTMDDEACLADLDSPVDPTMPKGTRKLPP